MDFFEENKVFQILWAVPISRKNTYRENKKIHVKEFLYWKSFSETQRNTNQIMETSKSC